MLPEAGISVVDSQYTTVALQLIVEAASAAISGGATREQAAARAEEVREKMLLLFVVDTLEYLAKGGRINNARALLGTMLKIKPILVLENGAIEPCEQVRSKKKAVARMVEMIEEHVADDCGKAKVGIAEALVPDEAEALRADIQELFQCATPIIHGLGPVIGTHTGPGLIGIAAYV